MIWKKQVFYFLIVFILTNMPAQAQCGNCRPSGFSLFYNYLLPGQVKQFTNPVLRANQVVNTVRNPSLLLSPCNPITHTAANLINTNVRGNLINNNSYTGSYIPAYNYNPPVAQVNQNAYVSGFDTEKNIDSGNSYFDSQTNSYVWVLPESSSP